ncbi:MAG: bifunctional folylpolyglutamate synthase/dihydrofolate synthase [Dehalococcoidia bacterium]|nr:bifunctional folylpolyglutamate synthase/dihydrofolate synthase [Dehalococcoidia bacterium]
MTSAPDDTALHAYVAAARRLMARGGFERTGDPSDARRWGLEGTRDWLDAHGRPDERLTVHVAGSKGKGSVATMVEAILRAAGARTMLTTSPDLHQKHERIAIDGRSVDYADFARLANHVLDDPATEAWSLFEVVTVMAWLAAAEAGCDWQVLEVGLGGRLDTTNAVRAKSVAVITPIDLEHTAILGDTIPLIAGEKAGIITGPCAVVVSPMRASALDVVRAKVDASGSTLYEATEVCAMRPLSQRLDGQEFDLRTPLRTYRKLRVPLVGPHQAENAATAVLAAELAVGRQGDELPEAAVREGLAGVRWPGRFEVARQRPLTILDGMHTPLAARRFRQALEATGVTPRRVVVLGLLAGKDIEAVVQALVGEQDEVIVAPPDSSRAADTAEVLRAVRETGAPAQPAPSIAAALERAEALAGERGAVLVAGSLYTVAEAREALLGITGDRALGIR